MSYADKVFKSMCRDIIDNGCDTQGELVRPMWPDTGEKAYTIKKFGVVNRYDLRKEFPALTLRKTAIKSAFDEILWIWQRQSNNIHDLNSHIWDEWADENGSIGKAYGYQIGKRYAHHKIKVDASHGHSSVLTVKEVADDHQLLYDIGATWHTEFSPIDEATNTKYMYTFLNQIDGVIYDLKKNPYSRRIMTNIYNFEELKDMNLYPCAYSMTFNVTKDKNSDKLVLNGILNQRSQDVLAANNWNVVQYSLLLMMIAQCCDMIAGELVHVIADCHIYDRHVSIIEELISREEYPAPKVWLDPNVKKFYEFTRDSVHVEDYATGPQITGIPIAV